MLEFYLRKLVFTYSASGPFTENKEGTKKIKGTGESRYNCQKVLHKACFQHDMAYGDFKDLTRRTDADKVIHVKAFNIAKNPKYDVYQRGISYIWFMSNKELEEELHQPVIRTF